MSFAKDFAKYIKKTGQRADKIQRASALQLFGAIVTRTPVDTGRARGNWNAKIGGINNSTDESRREQDAMSQGRSVIGKFKGGEILYLTNGLPYIVPLEYGNSTQAPQGMVRITAEEFRQAVRRAAQDER